MLTRRARTPLLNPHPTPPHPSAEAHPTLSLPLLTPPRAEQARREEAERRARAVEVQRGVHRALVLVEDEVRC